MSVNTKQNLYILFISSSCVPIQQITSTFQYHITRQLYFVPNQQLQTPLSLLTRKTQTVSKVEEDVNRAVDTSELGLARTLGEDRDISQTVNTLRLAGGESAVDDKAGRGILGVVSML